MVATDITYITMMDLKEKLDRPAWQQALLAVPPENRSLSQKTAAASISKLESAVSILCKHGARNALDLRNIVVVKCLYALVEAIYMNGDQASLRYYVSEKDLKRFDSYVKPFCDKIFLQGDLPLSTKEPEVLIALVLAGIIASSYHLITRRLGIEARGPGEKRYVNPHVQINCIKLIQFISDDSVKASCESYLKETMGAGVSSEALFSALDVNALSAHFSIPYSFMDVWVPPLYRAVYGLKEMSLCLEKNTKTLLNSSSPIYLQLTALAPLNYQFKILAWLHRSVSVQYKKEISNSIFKQWWKASDLFIKMMKKGLKQAEEQQPADAYSFATLSGMLLEAMLNGVSPTVCYSEIETLANDMASAKDACADWAPPVWLREKTALHKLVIFKVLPFLHNASTPKTYKTASVDVYTPGFLDLYSELDDILRGLSYREGSLTDRASGLMRCGAGVN